MQKISGQLLAATSGNPSQGRNTCISRASAVLLGKEQHFVVESELSACRNRHTPRTQWLPLPLADAPHRSRFLCVACYVLV